MSEPQIVKKGEFAEIVVPAGPQDTLTFRRSEYPGASDEKWYARWEGRQGFDKDYYVVFRWKDGWAYSRPRHPALGEFHGRLDTREQAMKACAEDFEKVVRLALWVEYMSKYEPGAAHTLYPGTALS